MFFATKIYVRKEEKKGERDSDIKETQAGPVLTAIPPRNCSKALWVKTEVLRLFRDQVVGTAPDENLVTLGQVTKTA